MANVHFAVATPNYKMLEHFNDFADAQIKDVVHGAPEVINGHFLRNDRPGLGVEFNAEAATELPQQRAHFDLWEEGSFLLLSAFAVLMFILLMALAAVAHSISRRFGVQEQLA